MNNTVEFIVKMRDMMSSGLGRLSSTSQSSFARMSQSASGMTSRNQILGMSFNELQRKIQRVESSIKNSTIPSQIAAARRELAVLERQSTRHAGNTSGGRSNSSSNRGSGIGGIAIGSMLGGFALQAGSAIVGAVGTGVSAMITKSMEKETAISGMSTFLGKQGAADAYKDIRQDAQITPFDTASLLQVNRALISTGLNAKDARTDTMNLANAIVAVGGGNDELSRMAANMGQIKQNGKATAMDIRQFAMAGINIYEMLHQSTGKSIAQVKEMDVTYEQLAKSMAQARDVGGMYYNALENSANTMFGKWSNVKDAVSNGLSDIGDAFSPVINKFLDLGMKFGNSIAPALAKAKPYIDFISNGINKMIDSITQIINGTSQWKHYTNGIVELFNYIKPSLFKIASYVSKMASDIISFVKSSEILKDIFSYTVWAVKKVFDVVGWVADKLIWLWENVVKPILEAIEKAYRWIKGVDHIEVKATKTIIAKKPKDEPKPPSALATNKNVANNNASAGKAAGDTVTGGGPKVVNIHLGKLFENIQFTTLNSGETAQELENIVTECLARVLYNGSKLV